MEIAGIVAGGERVELELVEGVGDDGAGGFFAEALAPEGAGDVDAELADVRVVTKGP